jgi:protein-S-isoprenylcysteine O-methyltransferase Ste14
MQGPRLVVLTVFQLIAFAVLLWFVLAWKVPWNPARYVGTALLILGAIFIAIARYQLGSSFSVTPQAHRLVTTGLYSKIRNPIYVFGSIMIAGLFLILQKPALWILLAVIVIAQTLRARKEARVLEAAFGDEYREYRRKTWF